MKNLLWLIVVGALTLTALVGVWELGFGLATQLRLCESNFRLELFKIIWQFLLLTVLAGAVGLLFKIQEVEAVARRRTERSLLRTRADLVRAYHRAKAIRRLLRGDALEEVNGQVVVRRREYNTLMRRLIEAQLRFEYYLELIESDRFLFPRPRADDIGAQLGRVEGYLNKVVQEFEGAWKKFGIDAHAPLQKFEELDEFLQTLPKEGTKSLFETEFKEPFHDALRLIEPTDTVQPRKDDWYS